MMIRRLSPDDLTAYRKLRLECIEANPSAVSFSYEEESALPLDQMRERLVYSPTIPEMVIVNLSVRTTNDVARALYRRLGFTVTGIDRRAIFADGAYHDEERMTLELDAA